MEYAPHIGVNKLQKLKVKRGNVFMKKYSLREELEVYGFSNLTSLELEVIQLVENECEELTKENVSEVILTVCVFGCTNCFSGLIHHCQTEEFYQKHSKEILALFEKSTQKDGIEPSFEKTHQNLSWFAFENVCHELLYNVVFCE